MQRAAYQNDFDSFLTESENSVIGKLTAASSFAVEDTQVRAWQFQVSHLRQLLRQLGAYNNNVDSIYFEYAIPRMGRRIDTLLIYRGILFVLEYKVGERRFPNDAIDQVMDYSLDLKHFHETSHSAVIAPILISTNADAPPETNVADSKNDQVLVPILCNAQSVKGAIQAVIARYPRETVESATWQQGRYQPTPTIIEAATALYSGHNVHDLSRSDASAVNLSETSNRLEQIISESQKNRKKSICFVTGVPGAGKTLVGLNIATQHIDPDNELYSVFLSGNQPLVSILHEALARDRVHQAKLHGEKVKKGEAKSQIKAFIQNVHHFRDEGIKDSARPPVEHVALFDEAQRAWDLEQTSNFMQRKKGLPGFNQSEPGFLISCMDRHDDWAVIVCLVGGGQEINTGEAGIRGWLEAIRKQYPNWLVHASPHLTDHEYQAANILDSMSTNGNVQFSPELHLSVSMRSFRAESVSAWVKAVLDGDTGTAQLLYKKFEHQYPIVITRSVADGKAWTQSQARGNERFGLVVSSNAQRLKPYAIDVKSPMDPVHWFLNPKDDVRSSFYMEDVATEFHVQGLELDWTCVAWDADFRRGKKGWEHFSFRGNKWQNIRKEERQRFQLNAYRVLLTRARQGMAIVVPKGDNQDPTRNPIFYNETYKYLRDLGISEI